MNFRDSKKTSRRAAVTGLLSIPLVATAQPSKTADPNHAELLKVREKVWRDWFAGDRKALLEILPANFVGIGAGEGAFRNRAETIADAEGFVAAGNRLTDLKIFDNVIQVFGDVHVIYCRFSFTVQDKAGASSTVAGRATEVFERKGSKWSHPGWHLDSGR